MSGHTSSLTHVAKTALAGVVIGLGALATAGQANAQPVVPPLPTPVPGETPPPGQPVMDVPGAEPVAAPAPPPVGAPSVPEVANQQYGQGSRPGPLSFLRDAWHQAQDPYGFAETPPGEMPAGDPAPAGSRSGTAAAARIPVADRPGVQRASAGGGELRRRPASAGGVLPVNGATAARVLRRASRPGAIAPVDPAALPPAGPIPPTP